MQALWGHIWKCTVEKSQTNATSVTLPLLGQTFWRHIWKHTLEKSRTNATSVISCLLMQAIWEDIWKYTVEKSQTNATSVTLHHLGQTVWGHTWKSMFKLGVWSMESKHNQSFNVVIHKWAKFENAANSLRDWWCKDLNKWQQAPCRPLLRWTLGVTYSGKVILLGVALVGIFFLDY